MKLSIWLKLGLAAGLATALAALLLGLTLAAPAVPQGISFDLAPVPPQSIIPGMVEVFTWTVTGGSPQRVDFEVKYPSGVTAYAQTYPGATGLDVTRVYTVPPAAPLGLWYSEVRFYSLTGGTLKAGGNFCVSERGNLRVFKFDDFNGNGVRDPGEDPVPDVLIQIQPAPGALCPSDPAGQFTGSDGYATWSDIAVGQYIVTEIVPADREATLPVSHTVDVPISATVPVTFANRIPPSAVAGRVWLDLDRDDALDSGESGLPNITVLLYGDPNGNGTHETGEPLVQQASSDATGAYLFSLVRAGDYVVLADAADPDLPAGVGPVHTPPSVAVPDLAPRETRTANINFQYTGVIGGRVWHDVNGSGGIDPGEPPLAGIAVCLYADANGNHVHDPGETQIGCQDSSTTGSYSFIALPGGDYIVDVDQTDADLPAGFVPTTTDPVALTLAAGENAGVNFGFRHPPTPTPTPTIIPQTGCITGQKVDDLHVGLPGWTIHARPRDAQSPVLTAVSDGQGYFYFTALAEGWWTVWEVMQPGWAPVTSDTFDVQVAGQQPCTQVRFKNRQACAQDVWEPDNTPAQASLITADAAPHKHTLEPPSDLDWFAFDAVAGGRYTLRTDSLLGSTDTFLSLYGPDGTTLLATNDDIVTGADKRSRIVWLAPAAGRYYARVRDYYQTGARGCLGYDFILTVRFNNYLPLLLGGPKPLPPTVTPTATHTPTPTRTPVPTRPPLIIPGLRHPKGLDVDLWTHNLYVASRDTNVVYQVNPIPDPAVVVRTIPVGLEPFGVAVNNKTGKVYVANFRSNSLSVISVASGAVLKTIYFLPYGEPTYVAVNETTNRIYVPLHSGGRLAVIRGDTDTLVTTLEVGAGAFGVAADPIRNRVFVSCRDARLIRVVDGLTNTILWGQTVSYPDGMPYALGIDASLGRLYASYAPETTNPRQVLVYRIPDEGPSLLTAVLVGNGGTDGGGGIVANPATHHVFVTNSADDSVTVFDGTTNMVLDWVPVGDDPMGVAVDPGLSYVWVGNRHSDTVSGVPDGY